TNSYPPNLITEHSFATYNLYQGENPTIIPKPTTDDYHNLTNDGQFSTHSLYQGENLTAKLEPTTT
ncbi:unnamed protein product, partial [Rotaria sp. Silwood1]